MALLDQAALANNGDFRARIQVAMVTAAQDVVGEDASADEAGSLRRQSLAYAVLNYPDSFVSRFAWSVVANPAITSASNDGDIQFTVNSVWSDLAGVISAHGTLVPIQ